MTLFLSFSLSIFLALFCFFSISHFSNFNNIIKVNSCKLALIIVAQNFLFFVESFTFSLPLLFLQKAWRKGGGNPQIREPFA